MFEIHYRKTREYEFNPGSTDRLAEMLMFLVDPVALSCEVQFTYDDGDGVSRIPLPGKPSTVDGDLTFEIRGLRIAYLEKDELSYMVTIDRPDNAEISHGIEFELVKPFTGELPNLVLERGLAISQGLFNRAEHAATRQSARRPSR